MKLIITGRRLEITKAFSQYVRKRFKKWSTFLGPNAAVHVTLEVEGYRHQVEAVAKDGPYSVTGKQTTKDMYQSVDLLSEKIGRQLMRQHEKLTNVKSTSRARTATSPQREKIRMPAGQAPVIDVETIAGKPMTQEEAVLQLLSRRKSFLVFEDAENGQLAVLEKQKDGSFRLFVKE
ncbi:ribosome-associated translation inhibitor RaiA [bacterium]|nr:ribosome-associated translation inhibitor RaiA [bacterium]